MGTLWHQQHQKRTVVVVVFGYLFNAHDARPNPAQKK